MKKWLFLLLGGILLYTRLVGIGWGLPYSLHPDELKMCYAVLDISAPKLYTPYFWAYGGFHINFVHILLSLFKIKMDLPHAVLGLRLLSVFFSIWTVYIAAKIVALCKPRSLVSIFITIIIFIFSPALIQFAHFGTTESILMWSYLVVIYYSLLIVTESQKKSNYHFFAVVAAVGIGAATKILALSYLVIFFVTILWIRLNKIKQKKKFAFILFHTFVLSIVMLIGSIVIAVALSPHYATHFNDFIGPLLYEKKLGSGEIVAFYTRQFIGTRPLLFQVLLVFPYALGIVTAIFSLLGFIFLKKTSKNNILRLSFLFYAIPMLLLFTKWTRNLAPIFPICIIFAALFLSDVYEKKNKFADSLVIFISICVMLPGVAFLSIYQNPDVRQVASEWIYNNIPAGATILSETANGIDVPTQFGSLRANPKPYNMSALDLYAVDESEQARIIFYEKLKQADYIFVPSRRVFMNHTCYANNQLSIINDQLDRCERLKKMYPILNNYYEELFSGRLGFKQIAFFTSYPRLTLFDKTIIEFPDEQAEETWTVFDHPTIRIFKRI